MMDSEHIQKAAGNFEKAHSREGGDKWMSELFLVLREFDLFRMVSHCRKYYVSRAVEGKAGAVKAGNTLPQSQSP